MVGQAIREHLSLLNPYLEVAGLQVDPFGGLTLTPMQGSAPSNIPITSKICPASFLFPYAPSDSSNTYLIRIFTSCIDANRVYLLGDCDIALRRRNQVLH
ncbi:hypothetical protein IG631_03821 [Alternaria alternata]|nr:hypothetical protein IG631_03821 [Alternaria alternata]